MAELASDFDTELKTRFPDLWHLANVFPELGTLMNQALQEDWEPVLFESHLRGTDWWRGRSDSARLWDVEKDRDPATAERRREERTRTISNKAKSWGITIPENELSTLVEQSLRWDYSQAEMDSFIAGYGSEGNLQGGDALATAQTIQSLGREYLMSVSDEDAQRFALQVLQGEKTLDGVKSQFVRQAEASFPQFSDQLNSGFSIMDATATIRSHVANVLEISSDQVDFNDDRWTDLIDHQTEDGSRRMMTRAEAGRWARNQEDYGSTDQAKSLMMGLMNSIGKTMGKIA